MALFNFGQGNGGLFGGVFPQLENGGPGGYERLPPELEARLAQEARDAAAAQFRARNGQSRGTADMSLFNDQPQTLTQQIMPSMPGAPTMQPQQPMPVPQQAPPSFGAPINVPSLKVASVEDNILPQNAMPTQGGPVPGVNFPQQPQAQQQAPQQAPQQIQAPGGGDRFMAGLAGLFNSPTLVGGIGNMIGGLATGQRQDAGGIAQRNQTMTAKAIYDGLLSNDPHMDPKQAFGIAMAAAGNPELAKAILPQALGPKNPPATMEEFYAREAERARRGVQPSVQAGQPGAPRTGPTIPSSYQDWIVQKNAAEAQGKEEGGARGKAAANLPVSQQRGQDVITQVDELLAHPGFDRVFGLVGAFPNIPGGNAAGAEARLKQVKGQAFLDAYELLKGGGAITEVEGAKATAAKARLDSAQSPEEARVALQDFKSAVRTGMQKLKEVAGQTPVTPPVNNGGWTNVTPGVRIREKQ